MDTHFDTPLGSIPKESCRQTSRIARYRVTAADIPPGIQVSRLVLVLTFAALCFLPALSSAATRVFVLNNSDTEIEVTQVSVDGDKLSKKAWKKGQMKISPGERASVLSINRTGKFNWMDPTPRFIEPGKTAIFTIQLHSNQLSQPITIKQKLLGTGSGSKLWYAMDNPSGFPNWTLPYVELAGQLPAGNSASVNYQYLAIATDSDDDLELIIQ